MKKHKTTILLLLISFIANLSFAQNNDCAYPVIFIHGWTGNQTSFEPVYDDPDFINVWGSLADLHHSVLNTNTQSNIWGADGIPENEDDDVLVEFVNETNDLAPGCIYAINFENFWNEDENNPVLDQNSGDSPSLFDSDSNEASILKQGYALGKAIEKVLAANPDKEKVILVGHSMGGLSAREYLQRRFPETPTGTPLWWVDPNSPDGHKVAKLVTTVTPHLGSNLFGNSSFDEKKNEADDGTQDLASEAVRDLRYSYACGFLNLDDCPGVYLFGGDENDFTVLPYPYWSEDVDCDGDETSPNVIGVNIDGVTQGIGDEWDGTYDNPQMPLPDNVRYTWITSDIPVFYGDGVVSLDRQYLYDGGTPRPSDGTAFRLADTLLTDYSHITITGDVNTIVSSMDESDYPKFAWEVNIHQTYSGLPQRRSANAPEANSNDPDWFKFTLPISVNDDLELDFTPHPNLSGQIDIFSTPPSDYLDMNTNGNQTFTFSAGSGPMNLLIPYSSIQYGETYYMRVTHNSVASNDWKIPYHFEVKACLSPTNDYVDGITDTRAIINWDAQPNATKYAIRYRDVNSNNWIVKGTSLTEKQLFNLSPLTQYEYKLKSFCSGSWTRWTDSKYFTTDYCTSPTNPSVTLIKDVRATVTWNEIPTAIKYQVRYQEEGTSIWSSKVSNDTTVILTGLIPSTTYDYQIRSLCPFGWTVWTNLMTYSFTTSDCTEPVLTNIQAGNTEALVYWTAATNANYYRLKYREVGTTTWTQRNVNATSFNITNLIANTDYELQLRTYCNYGWSTWTPIHNFTTGSVNNFTQPIPTEFAQVKNILSFEIFPNPANDKINLVLESNNWVVNSKILVTDVYGKIMLEKDAKDLMGGLNKIEIDIQELTIGTYFVYFSDGKEKIIKRFVKVLY